jgi:hypothetical protein
MAMSLDGFITGPHDDAQNPAGINGMRLMDWLGGGDEGDNEPGDYTGEHIELDLVRTLQAATTLHLRYEVRRP